MSHEGAEDWNPIQNPGPCGRKCRGNWNEATARNQCWEVASIVGRLRHLVAEVKILASLLLGIGQSLDLSVHQVAPNSCASLSELGPACRKDVVRVCIITALRSRPFSLSTAWVFISLFDL